MGLGSVVLGPGSGKIASKVLIVEVVRLMCINWRQREGKMKFQNMLIVLLTAFGLVGSASAETRITYKSAKSTSSYYQMAVEIAEAMKAGSSGAIIVTVEESQGSVQNVMEAIEEQTTMSLLRHQF